jgi:hypothetical protein
MSEVMGDGQGRLLGGLGTEPQLGPGLFHF